MPAPGLDVKKAIQLRRLGHTWREIGKLLAERDGRMMTYQAESVIGAVRRYQDELKQK